MPNAMGNVYNKGWGFLAGPSWLTVQGHTLPEASRRDLSLGPAQGEPVGIGWSKAGFCAAWVPSSHPECLLLLLVPEPKMLAGGATITGTLSPNATLPVSMVTADLYPACACDCVLFSL